MTNYTQEITTTTIHGSLVPNGIVGPMHQYGLRDERCTWRKQGDNMQWYCKADNYVWKLDVDWHPAL